MSKGTGAYKCTLQCGGVVVCTVDKLAGPGDQRESDLPRYLLTKEVGIALVFSIIGIASKLLIETIISCIL